MNTPVVTSVRVIQPFVLAVTFKDGEQSIVDLSGELHGEVFEPLKDPEFFNRVTVDPRWHTVVWPNGADLAPEFLYEERFRQRRAG